MNFFFAIMKSTRRLKVGFVSILPLKCSKCNPFFFTSFLPLVLSLLSFLIFVPKRKGNVFGNPPATGTGVYFWHRHAILRQPSKTKWRRGERYAGSTQFCGRDWAQFVNLFIINDTNMNLLVKQHFRQAQGRLS